MQIEELKSVQMIIGALFLLIGLLGGGLEVSAIRIPPVTLWVRLLSGAIGALFLLAVFIPPAPNNPTANPPVAGRVTDTPATVTPDPNKAPNAVEISIIYAPEETKYLETAIAEFNRSYAQGINPLTGQRLALSERPIYVTGKAGSSGVVQRNIVNAILYPESAATERPTIYAPAASFWLSLINHATGQTIFDLAESPATALTPVVIAIWESRLQALQAKHNQQSLGWEDLLQVINDPDGWAGYGLPGRQTVYYGHTDPYISSTGLAALVSEFYAGARYGAQQPAHTLTLDLVNDATVQQGVRNFEQAIKHYAERTTEFKEYIGKGPDYVDFVPLQEDDLIYINQGKAQNDPGNDRLIALYPKEGAIWLDHPFAIPNASWVSAEQRQAAKQFTNYVLSEPVQRQVMTVGLMRPALTTIPLSYPFVKELGVDPSPPQNVLPMPDAETLAAIQASWRYVKKKADILLVVDTSGSMANDNKLVQAQKAITLFLQKLIDHNQEQNRVGLLSFNGSLQWQSTPAILEGRQSQLTDQINALQPEGETALYDALVAATKQLQDGDDTHIRAIILLSDGKDNSSSAVRSEVLAFAQNDTNPILIFPVAYGRDADQSVLDAIARTFKTKLYWSDPAGIEQLFLDLSSYF